MGPRLGPQVFARGSACPHMGTCAKLSVRRTVDEEVAYAFRPFAYRISDEIRDWVDKMFLRDGEDTHLELGTLMNNLAEAAEQSRENDSVNGAPTADTETQKQHRG